MLPKLCSSVDSCHGCARALSRRVDDVTHTFLVGVYEFTLLGVAVNAGDLKSTDVTDFFSQTITTVSRRQKTNCRGNDEACTVAEQSSSRWEVHFTLLALLKRNRMHLPLLTGLLNQPA